MNFQKNKTMFLLGGGVLVLLLFAIVGKQAGWIGKGDRIKVSVEKCVKRTIVETVSASGKIYPEVEVKLSSDVSGEIIELFVEEGDSVRMGDKLVIINPDIYEQVVERSQASLNSSKANKENTKARLQQAQAQFENAELSYNRSKKLHADKVISDADFENSETAWRSAKADLEALKQSVRASEFNVMSTQASVTEAKKNLLRTIIVAPIDGIVSKLNVEKGERVVGTLQMAGTEVLRIANFEYMEAQVDVSENDVLTVSVGDEVDIEVDAYLDRVFIGKVTQVANSASSLSQSSEQVTNFTVKIRILVDSYKDLLVDQKLPFRPGMSAAVEIKTKQVDDVLTVPIQAVTARDENDSTESKTIANKKLEELVFVYKDDKVEKRVVTTGVQDNSYIQINSGLTEDDEVVSAPYSAISRKLDDGDEVEKVSKKELFKGEEE